MFSCFITQWVLIIMDIMVMRRIRRTRRRIVTFSVFYFTISHNSSRKGHTASATQRHLSLRCAALCASPHVSFISFSFLFNCSPPSVIWLSRLTFSRWCVQPLEYFHCPFMTEPSKLFVCYFVGPEDLVDFSETSIMEGVDLYMLPFGTRQAF